MQARRTILIIDDAALFCELEALFLARSGRVLTARSGQEGLAIARRERPDVAVVDMLMPEMAGDAVCKEIKADPQLASIPVIVVTAGDLPEERARAIRAGADDVLSKPIDRVTLIQAVNRFVRFPQVRGLARVELDTRVHIRCERQDGWGRALNLSRGGMFVEADRPVPRHAEVELSFQLPDARPGAAALSPTAKVVWRREASQEGGLGLGLQFLALDRASAERIDAYVHERARSWPHPERPGSFLAVR